MKAALPAEAQDKPLEIWFQDEARIGQKGTLTRIWAKRGWHSPTAIRPPNNVTLIYLPPYAPELNPVENVWEFLRANNLALRIYETYDAIVDACCTAWNSLIATPARLTSITQRKWATAS